MEYKNTVTKVLYGEVDSYGCQKDIDFNCEDNKDIGDFAYLSNAGAIFPELKLTDGEEIIVEITIKY